MQSAIISDPFTTTYVDPIIREYQAAFGRVPDQAGVAYWVNVVAANPSLLTVLNTTFASSSEFMTRYGTTSATQVADNAIVNALYTNVLGRAPDAAGFRLLGWPATTSFDSPEHIRPVNGIPAKLSHCDCRLPKC